MNSLIKWFGMNALTAVFWVFVLSINYQGRTLFSYAHHYMVQNDIVRDIDAKLEEVWIKVYDSARLTYAELTGPSEKDSTY